MDRAPDGCPAGRVEARGGLVEEDDARLGEERSSDIGTTPLPAGELAVAAVEQLTDLDHAREQIDARRGLEPCEPGQRRAHPEVLAHRQGGVEERVLEHHADIAAHGVRIAAHVVSGDRDRTRVEGTHRREAANRR